MNRLNFEDSIFILNMLIRMIRDTLRLNPPPELFLKRILDELVFVDSILEILVRTFTENGNQYNSNNEFDYISDTEWQLSQVLNEFSFESSPFSARSYPEILEKITTLRKSSNARRKTIEEASLTSEITQTEPVVTSAELTGLLGGV